MPFCRRGGGKKIHPGHSTRPRDWSHVPNDPRSFRSLSQADPLFPLWLLHAGRPGFDRKQFWNLALETRDEQGLPSAKIAGETYDASTGCPDERVIEADVPRTPLHGVDEKSCRDLLRAVSRSNPSTGYCQGMSYIAVVFLGVVSGDGGGGKGEPDVVKVAPQSQASDPAERGTMAERAFPLMLSAMRGPLRGLHATQLLFLPPLSARFEDFLGQCDQELADQLKLCGCSAQLLVPGWYMATFAQTFPPGDHVIRLWDHIVLVGIPALEAAGLAACLARKEAIHRATGRRKSAGKGGGQGCLAEVAKCLKELDSKAMKTFWKVYPSQIEFVMAQPPPPQSL